MISGLLESLASARVFDLEQLRYAGAPTHPAHAPGFNYFLHRHHARGAAEARTGASGVVVMPEHSGTHIDALSHQAENLTLHGASPPTTFRPRRVSRSSAWRPWRRSWRAASFWTSPARNV